MREGHEAEMCHMPCSPGDGTCVPVWHVFCYPHRLWCHQRPSGRLGKDAVRYLYMHGRL